MYFLGELDFFPLDLPDFQFIQVFVGQAVENFSLDCVVLVEIQLFLLDVAPERPSNSIFRG